MANPKQCAIRCPCLRGGQPCLQMGGAEGVRAAEQYTLVVGLVNGMMMHAVPRQVGALPIPNGHAHTNGHAVHA